VGDRVLISGTTALNARGVVEGPGDLYRQTRSVLDTIFAALAEAGGTPADLVYTKTYFTDLSRMADYTRAWLEAFGDVRPTSTTLGIPALLRAVFTENLCQEEPGLLCRAALTTLLNAEIEAQMSFATGKTESNTSSCYGSSRHPITY
jgi:enamine deaminase RidA (YjgF/YER057c/UK114 family)